jgi:hypothetical protein
MVVIFKCQESIDLKIVIYDNDQIIELNTKMVFNKTNHNVTNLFSINTSGNCKTDYFCGNQYFSNNIPVILNGIIKGLKLTSKKTKTMFYCYKIKPNAIFSKIKIYDNNKLIKIYRQVNFIFDACSCFCEGSKILCLKRVLSLSDGKTPINNSQKGLLQQSQLKEEYRLVQDLMVGDFVKSYLHGYRKVSKILKGSFVNNPKDKGVANCMYKMLKTDDNGLIEDLTLTRNHGILVDKLSENEEKKVDKNNLSVIDNLLSIITTDCDKFKKVIDTNVYKYYHFSLDGDGDNDRRFGVYANGILVEVPSNNMMDGALNIKPLDF